MSEQNERPGMARVRGETRERSRSLGATTAQGHNAVPFVEEKT